MNKYDCYGGRKKKIWKSRGQVYKCFVEVNNMNDDKKKI